MSAYYDTFIFSKTKKLKLQVNIIVYIFNRLTIQTQSHKHLFLTNLMNTQSKYLRFVAGIE